MNQQALNEKYPGRKVYRDGDRVVVRIPVQFRRRNGRQMIVAADEDEESQARPGLSLRQLRNEIPLV